MSKKKHFRVYLPKIIGGVIFTALLGFLIHVIVTFINDKPSKAEKKIQPITIFKPPPPPPPPPKTEPPPEQKVEEKIEEPTPEPEPDPEPLPDVPDEPAGDTGLDAEGVAGSDAFGLVGRPGGRGLFGGGGGNPYGHYAAGIKQGLIDIFAENEDLRRKSYSAVIKIWLDPDGSVAKYELSKSSSDPDIDKLLKNSLAKYKKAEPPPPGMEQPIKFKISSRL